MLDYHEFEASLGCTVRTEFKRGKEKEKRDEEEENNKKSKPVSPAG